MRPLLLLAILIPSAFGQSCTCYETIQDQLRYNMCTCKKSWSDAEDYCRLVYEGRLARPLNASLQDVIAGRLGVEQFSDTWVGGLGTRTHWQWAHSRNAILGQGCHSDDPVDPDLDSLMSLSSVTPSSCIEECRAFSYLYAGVQAGFQCFCGNEFGSYGHSTSCNQLCLANASYSCGGYYANYVYAVNGGNFNNWAFYEPSTGSWDDKECTVLTCDAGASSWKWRADTCTRRKKYICQRGVSADGTCSDSRFRKIGNSCFYREETVFGTWYEAHMMCNQMNAWLLEDNDNSLHSLLETELLECYMSSFWIGGTKVDWHWNTGDSLTYFSWATGRPSNVGDRCIAMSFRLSNDFEWSDVLCDQQLSFICETDLSGTTSSSTTTTTTTTTTPSVSTTTFSSTTTAVAGSSITRTSYASTPSSVSGSTTRSQGSTGTTRATTSSGGDQGDGGDGNDEATQRPVGPSSPVPSTTSRGVAAPGTGGNAEDGGLSKGEWIGLGVGLGLLFLLLLLLACVLCKKRKKKYNGKNSPMENGLISSNPFIRDSDFAFVNSKPITPLAKERSKANGLPATRPFQYPTRLLTGASSATNGSLPRGGGATSSTSVSSRTTPAPSSSHASGSLPRQVHWPVTPTNEQNGYIADLTDLQVEYIDPSSEVPYENYAAPEGDNIYDTIENTNNNNGERPGTLEKPRAASHNKGAAPSPPKTEAASPTQPTIPNNTATTPSIPSVVNQESSGGRQQPVASSTMSTASNVTNAPVKTQATYANSPKPPSTATTTGTGPSSADPHTSHTNVTCDTDELFTRL